MKHLEETKNEIRTEILEVIKDNIDISLDNTVEEFIFDMFNADPYIIGTHHAKKWLTRKDVFNCLQILTDYENDLFGESYFDIGNPEEIVGRLALFTAEEILYGDIGLEYESIINEETIKLIKETP